MRHTRSNGKLLHHTLALCVPLLWQCTDDGSGMSAQTGASAGSAGNGAVGAAGMAGAAGALAAGNAGSAGSTGTIAGAFAAGSGAVGVTGGAGAAGTDSMLPVAGSAGTAGTSAGTGGDTAAGTGGDPGSSGAGAGPALPSSGCGVRDVPPSGSVEIEVDGTQRELVVRVPSTYDPDHPHRLVLAWHGLGGSAMQTASAFGLASRAGDAAIFVAGQALVAQSGQMSGFASWSTDGTDTEYARALIDWAKASYCIDGNRVFSIGVSNGGMMTNIVACQLGDLVRGSAAIAGGGPAPWVRDPCVGPVATWITHGNQDNNVPFSYGEMSRDQWLELNGCDATSTPVTPEPCEEFQGCADGYPVQFCEHDGGHTVPSFTAESVWAFFERF